MTTLGTAIVESVLYHYGTGELLSRLSDPFWFQAFGCVNGRMKNTILRQAAKDGISVCFQMLCGIFLNAPGAGGGARR
jgi:hypothetical protein